MSLILGIYSKKEKIDKKEIKEVLEDFALNGKRNIETKFDNKILFSIYKANFETLNIVENEDKSLIILLGGEVYDFSDGVEDLIKKGHKFNNKENCAEFILHSYEEYADSFLKNINGTFAFAIYNKLKDELILGNDSFGIYPLFIYTSNEYVIFSSEYEAITKYKKFEKELNYEAIAEYFTLGLPLGNKTFFRKINNLYPGSLLRINKDKIDFKQYDKLDIKIDKSKDIESFAKELSKLVYKATQDRVKNPKSIVCDLTGGLDTRLTLGNLTKKQRESMEFSTYGSPWVRDDDNQEIIIAKMLADEFNFKHAVKHTKNVLDGNEEFGVSFFQTRRNIYSDKKRFTGHFGTQFLGGSYLIDSPIKIDNINKNTIKIKFKKIFTKNFQEKASNPYSALKKELEKIKAENKEFLFDIHQLTRGFFTKIFGGSRTDWLDPYRKSLIGYNIFLDKNLLKFLLTVPKEYLADRKLYNIMYQNYFPHLLKIPTTRKEINPIKKGIHPYSARRQRYDKALKSYLECPHTYDKQFYSKKFMDYVKNHNVKKNTGKIYSSAMSSAKKINNEKDIMRKAYNIINVNKVITYTYQLFFYSGEEKLIKQFIDFEAWYRKFIKE